MTRSLLERLEADEGGASPPPARGGVAGLIDAIRRHLLDVLNTRLGGTPAAPDLGLADFNDGVVESPDVRRLIAADIRRCIEAYEPRLAAIRVEALPVGDDPLALQFRVAAELPLAREADRVELEIVLDGGRVSRIGTAWR